MKREDKTICETEKRIDKRFLNDLRKLAAEIFKVERASIILPNKVIA
jgi:hypothetical protein